MSAIAGIYRLDSQSVQAEHGHLVMEVLAHFPADQRAVWNQGPVMLGCHAQWMTLQSTQEQLPHYDPVRKLAITADIILDNRDELLDQLMVHHALRSRMTDSEIVLKSYEKWGSRMPERLIGDFAFVIWDEEKQLLFGARDFSGARTLYYHHSERHFSFCTMIKPLLSLPYVHKQLNENWLAQFMAISGVFEPPDVSTTVYDGIHQLPPSHMMTITRNQISLTKYNALRNVVPLQLSSSQEYEEAFRDVFQRAVMSRLCRSHKQAGAYLSGGLDSGSVVSFAAKALQQQNRPLQTFSYVPEDEFEDWTPKRRLADERPLIAQTVQFVENIQPRYLDFKGSSAFSEMDDWLDILESPYKFFDNSFWLRGIHEQASRADIGILLNGQRGNYSISWGPALDYYGRLMRSFNWIQLTREVKQYSKNTNISRKALYSVICRKAFPGINRLKPAASSHEWPQWIHSDFAKKTGVYDQLQDRSFTGIGSTYDLPDDPLVARQVHFDRVNVWSTTGTSGSKLSLRYGIGGHDPTNDLRVIRFCLSAPIEQFVQQGMDRALIRRSTKGWLPDSIRLNQRTRGIQAADSIHRLRNHWPQMITELEQMQQDTQIQQMINMPVVEKAIQEARHGIHPNQAYHAPIKLLMRSLILYRFLKKTF
ncbi:asparagine synthase-related protein [Paenibacillus lemnae]|uniref:asparagine synthase (glutamine-hydrolyzing) n=1 Tax=Paenibacillus lemnae TaxID=1330551 RepID=A0A848M654_PAELE|nr:asparagine synthase-related protein [Paenibacillus lemnae]NMO95701.1 asparagine synthetase B [Paenibacillus lemnae]